MKAGIYYLNNSGSRWVVLGPDGRREQHTFKTRSGKTVKRRVNYFKSWGNFAIAVISWKGKMVGVFCDELLND